MKAISYKQRNGRHRRALCPGAPQGRLCVMNGCQGPQHTWVFAAVPSCPQVSFFPGAPLTGWWGPWHQARDTASESVRTTVKRVCTVVVVQLLSCIQFFATPWSWLPCPPSSPRGYSNSCSLSRWCHPTISSSVALFFSCPHSFSASGSFPKSWLLASGSQSITLIYKELKYLFKAYFWCSNNLIWLFQIINASITLIISH